ncbi:MAG: cytochrome c biogenesis protein CcsA, partial [Paracoccaceae bacterium]
MTLWEYANPKRFMDLSGRLLPVVTVLSALCFLVGLMWGFFFTPDDYKQGSTVKIIYLHVPAALMAINTWLMMLVASIIWLVRRHHVSALAAKAAAPVGLTFTVVALVTGAIWGQPMWGTWWVWDPRLTSFLI